MLNLFCMSLSCESRSRVVFTRGRLIIGQQSHLQIRARVVDKMVLVDSLSVMFIILLREFNEISCDSSSSSLSFHHLHVSHQLVLSQCLTQPMAMPLTVVRSWVEQAVFIMGQTTRCCMVCLMPPSQVYGSFHILLVDGGTRICNQIYLIPRAATWTLL